MKCTVLSLYLLSVNEDGQTNVITMALKNVVLIVSSPTASGKTDVALQVAQQLPVEILSADSRQIYKYTTIGTAKPSKEELRAVPHHFVDMLEPDSQWNAGKFAAESRSLIQDIFKRNRIPFVVGGTGLYIKALIDGIADIPQTDRFIRQRLLNRYQREGLEKIVTELKRVDPYAAESIDTQNPRRVLRALEIYYMTGMTRAELERKSNDPLQYELLWFGLNWDREILYRRIEERVDRMIQQGLIEEVQSLLAQGYTENTQALQSVGYTEIIEYLKGKLSKEDAINLIKQNSRRFAKRQMTWFRKEKRIHWLDVRSEVDLENAAGVIVDKYRTLEQKNRGA